MQFIMVVVISAHLPTEHSLFHAHVPLSATEVLLLQDRVQLSRMSHCAAVARKPICLEFTPEAAVGDILVA